MNCRMRKNSQRTTIGMMADFIFFMTMNFISAPETITPIRSLTGQASGRTKISMAAMSEASKRETARIARVWLRTMEVRSTR